MTDHRDAWIDGFLAARAHALRAAALRGEDAAQVYASMRHQAEVAYETVQALEAEDRTA